MTEVEVHMATYSRRQVAQTKGSTNSITTVVEVASGKGLHKEQFNTSKRQLMTLV